MNLIRKKKQAKDLYLAGDVKEALRIAATFRKGVTRDESKTLKLGYEVIAFPDFYRQLGRDLDLLTEKAKEVFELRIVK